MKLVVALNGTDKNPFELFGLSQNPFPQTVKAEWDRYWLRVQRLGGPPIPKDRAEEYIREVLRGFSDEFIQICVNNYRPGEYIRFFVSFPDL